MYFSVGIEQPTADNTAYGLVVPALCTTDFSCISAADSQAEIAPAVTEAIMMTLEQLQEQGLALTNIQDLGPLSYQQQAEYAYCDSWLLVYIDLSSFDGKPKRINISMPDTLISRIDQTVKNSPDRYRDRSHFLATAARHELETASN
ncbi:type II toxin-antitoxin system HicB family antitoxin [Alishewanella sp. BS5-314]|uniref:type II toxin-antitoxin system HicB family antitoxin n=1 Tax=Alishewanella sp. BS5-314 TaxID=2755587 RepID=UPI0021BB8C28|nr:type II toxin-antitoxin system HicB family antitoxin [Alishewanella sp. BS5-314]MCT8124561.1 type II toxin-antitoxin system HicB family antitoxin [Alishewanella sp. BS5-314]